MLTVEEGPLGATTGCNRGLLVGEKEGLPEPPAAALLTRVNHSTARLT